MTLIGLDLEASSTVEEEWIIRGSQTNQSLGMGREKAPGAPADPGNQSLRWSLRKCFYQFHQKIMTPPAFLATTQTFGIH